MGYKTTKKFEYLSREEKIALMFDLINAFRLVRTPIETALFLQDLLTANEIRNLSIRLRIAKLLLSGSSHREIQEELHTSLATITKVRSWLEKGGEGLKSVIEKLPLKWDIPKKLPRGPIEFYLPQALMALAQYGIAKSQERGAASLLKGAENKEIIDRNLQKYFDEYYKEKTIKRKSADTRIRFQKKISSSEG